MNVSDRNLGRPRGLLIGFVLVIAACSGAPSTPSATSSPAASPRASVDASTPSAAQSPAPSPRASAGSGPSSSASSAASSGDLKVTSREFNFLPKSLGVNAGQPFTIVFRNADGPGVIHDLDIRKKDGTTVVVDQDTIDGGQTAEYEYPELAAGDYVFICSIHPIPNMTGKLTVS